MREQTQNIEVLGPRYAVRLGDLRERHEHAKFAAALADARQGGHPMVYAVAPTGRFVHVEEARWDGLADRHNLIAGPN